MALNKKSNKSPAKLKLNNRRSKSPIFDSLFSKCSIKKIIFD